MLRKCDNCKKEESYEKEFDCEDWSEDQLLCDDCFFNELYNKRGESNG